HLAEIRHRPDVLIVYCGHNEFSARIPLSRDRPYYADAARPRLASTLAEKAVAWSFVHKLVARNIEKCRIAIPPPSNGNRALIDSPAYTPEEYDLLLGDFAAARGRLARLLAEQGDTAGAYEQAVAARDLDGYPQRCPTAFQEVYRDTARRHDAIYVDGQAYFHAVSPDGLLDDRLFHDAMHPSYRGQLALAQAVLRGLHARRAFGWPADAPEPVLDPAECAAHFKLDPGAWRTLCLWGMMSYEITGPASFDPTLRRFKYEAFARAADSIEMGVPPGAAGFPGIGRMEPIPVVPFGDASAPGVR
ncbi:hypothetical protein HK102_013089, partial [Quaeritorhiza haematococci]